MNLVSRLLAVVAVVIAPHNVIAQTGKLSLKSREKLAAPSPLAQTVYLTPTGHELLAAGGFSPDNGKTWQLFTPTPDFDSKLPHGYRREKHPLFVDHSNGQIVQIINAMDTPGVDLNEIEPHIALTTYYLRYRVSIDGGRTYLFDEPIVHHDKKYSPEHPLAGVWKGKNALFMGDLGSLPIRTREGTLLVPAQATVLGEDEKLSNPAGGFTYTDVRVLRGKWTKDKHLEWDAADPVQVSTQESIRGMIEPTLAQMPDGRILMIMRGANGGPTDPKFKIPSYKWMSVSTDDGRSWSKPVPWTYTTGEHFFSPGSMSQLVPHSTGRLFWVGNICKENARGNSPRHPLVAGEVDIQSMQLICDSIITIDDKHPEDTAGVELCAHTSVFEDRVTGDLVLPMLRWTGKYKRSEPFLYRIAVSAH
jgi:hypothetical protein